MSNQVTRTDIYKALAKKCGFEVVQEIETNDRLKVIGRCSLDRWSFLLPVIHALLTASEQASQWSCDISKNYILNEGKVLYCWRIIFQGTPIVSSYVKILSVIDSASRPARVELDSMLLPGCKPNQVRGGVNARGKGSSSIGEFPLILQSKNARSSP
jgi:hypothetical protein